MEENKLVWAPRPADFDGDGLLDIFKTNFADDTHTMYKNQGGNNFEDDTIGSGLAVNTKYLGWGTAFLDFDNGRMERPDRCQRSRLSGSGHRPHRRKV